MNLGRAVRICFEKYAVFVGRAGRAEFWYWTLFTIALQIIISLLAVVLDGGIDAVSVGASFHPLRGVETIVSLALFLPGLAVQVRRLHDLDKSGWWLLIALIPLIGWILLLVWFCTRGTLGPNRFGADPLPG